jgi:hypothetical protein
MSTGSQYAIPLFALVDRDKVDLKQPLPETFAEHLALYLENSFAIRSLSAQIHLFRDEPFLVLYSVPEESLPALCSLVDVQRTQLYRYQRSDEETVMLTPLNVKVD